MKIIRISQGFTTNSSGSYEFLGSIGIQASVTPTSTPADTNVNSNTTASSTPNVDTSLYQFIPETPGDLIILLVSLTSGLAAIILIVKEILKSLKNKIK